MTIRDLKALYFDNVCLYVEVEDYEHFKDLYKGKISDVPESLLNSEIRNFGAKRKDLLDIHIEKGA